MIMIRKTISEYVIIISLIILIQAKHKSCSITNANAKSSIDQQEMAHRTGRIMKKCDTECDSIVNKCKHTGKCICDFKKDPACTKNCVDCLEEKFGYCCHCIKGLCTTEQSQVPVSHLGEIKTHDQQYFETLTEDDDIHNRWRVIRQPKTFGFSHPDIGFIELAHRSRDDYSHISHDTRHEIVNCTVAYINRPLSLKKCARSCTAMGASYYRWFHKFECCECIGLYCFSQGFEEPQCIIDNY